MSSVQLHELVLYELCNTELIRAYYAVDQVGSCLPGISCQDLRTNLIKNDFQDKGKNDQNSWKMRASRLPPFG